MELIMRKALDPTQKIEYRSGQHWIAFGPSPKRVRVMFNGKTVADTLCAGLMREAGRMPVYYFPRPDVRMDLMERTNHVALPAPRRGVLLDAPAGQPAVGERRMELRASSVGFCGDRRLQWAKVYRPRAADASFSVDRIGEPVPPKDGLSGAIRLANQLKLAIVVVDPDGVWKPEWGELYRRQDDAETE